MKIQLQSNTLQMKSCFVHNFLSSAIEAYSAFAATSTYKYIWHCGNKLEAEALKAMLWFVNVWHFSLHITFALLDVMWLSTQQ